MNLATTASTSAFASIGSAEWVESLRRAEDSFRKVSAICRLQKTAHPTVFCSTLPRHWRSNKSLPTPFVVVALQPISDGTKVSIAAGNEENHTADVKNNVAEFGAQMARFTDLRFVGKSGRGKNFNLTITIFSKPLAQVITVVNAIKVTVDGPRDSRNANKSHNSQQNSRKREKTKFGVNMFENTQMFDSSLSPPAVKQPKFNVLTTNAFESIIQNGKNANKNQSCTMNNNDAKIAYELNEPKNVPSSKRCRMTKKFGSLIDYARKNAAPNAPNAPNSEHQAAAMALYNSMLAAAFGSSIRQNNATLLPQLLIPNKNFAVPQLSPVSPQMLSPSAKVMSNLANLTQKQQSTHNNLLSQSDFSSEPVSTLLAHEQQNWKPYSPPNGCFLFPQTSAFHPLTQILAAASAVRARASTVILPPATTHLPLSQMPRLPIPAAPKPLANVVQVPTTPSFNFEVNNVYESHTPLTQNSNSTTPNSLLLYQQLILKQLRNQQQQREEQHQQQELEQQQQQQQRLIQQSKENAKITSTNENALQQQANDNFQQTTIDANMTISENRLSTPPSSKSSSDEQIVEVSSSTLFSLPSTSFCESRFGGDREADSGKIELRQRIPACGDASSSLREFAQSFVAASVAATAAISAEPSAADVDEIMLKESARDSHFPIKREKEERKEEEEKDQSVRIKCKENVFIEENLLNCYGIERHRHGGSKSKSCEPECIKSEREAKQQEYSYSTISTPSSISAQENSLKFKFEGSDEDNSDERWQLKSNQGNNSSKTFGLLESYDTESTEKKDQQKAENIEKFRGEEGRGHSKKRQQNANHLWRPFETTQIVHSATSRNCS